MLKFNEKIISKSLSDFFYICKYHNKLPFEMKQTPSYALENYKYTCFLSKLQELNSKK